ncbi:MAG: biopolymer transporter ExbB [Paracoccaceae bacterium]
MSRPVREAEPTFSQPVRQILMMFVVIALIGAGGYLAYSQIFPIFLSSPWLNGVILGVFAIGVGSCFWQVVALVFSVSWIEGFAADRPGYEPAAAPSLLAPLAALLRSRGARTQISNSSARSILESVASRIEEARDMTRYLGSLLIFLGLLGTFFGLATTVPGVVETIRALAPKEGQSASDVFEKLMGGLGTQLSGMGTAFASSLLGLAGSLVVGLLELFVTRGQNRFYRELEEWVSSFTRISFAAEAEGGSEAGPLAGLLDQLVEQMETLQTFVGDAETRRAGTDERLGRLAQSLDRLTQKLGAQPADGGVAAEILGRIAEGQAKMVRIMETNAADSGVDGGDAESRMRLRSIDVQLLRLLEEVAAGRQESMSDLRGDLAQLIRAVRALTRTTEAASAAPVRRP